MDSSHEQSALHPAGPAAERISELWWLMASLLGVAFLAVAALVYLAVRRRAGTDTPPLGTLRFILVGGVAVPLVVSLVLLIDSLGVTRALRLPGTGVTVEVVGHQWWWEVRYPDLGIVTANEIHVPVGRPVRIMLRSADVVHSFWVPNLAGKMDMLPDVINRFWVRADRPGIYRGQCAEFCGLQHARMAFTVEALPPAEFQAWADARRPKPATEAAPPPAEHARGLEVFMASGCATCHTIRGTGATGRVGPDLTHVGSRNTLGAGTVPNTGGDMAGWIANSQKVKPGNLMPRSYLAPADLHALVRYLRSLE